MNCAAECGDLNLLDYAEPDVKTAQAQAGEGGDNAVPPLCELSAGCRRRVSGL